MSPERWSLHPSPQLLRMERVCPSMDSLCWNYAVCLYVRQTLWEQVQCLCAPTQGPGTAQTLRHCNPSPPPPAETHAYVADGGNSRRLDFQSNWRTAGEFFHFSSLCLQCLNSSPLAYGAVLVSGVESSGSLLYSAHCSSHVPSFLPVPRLARPPPTSVHQPSGPSLCFRVFNAVCKEDMFWHQH